MKGFTRWRKCKPEKVTPAIIEFVDIAGLVKGASKRRAWAINSFPIYAEVNAIIHVVRCFEDVMCSRGSSVNPHATLKRSAWVIFADLEMLEEKLTGHVKC